MRKPFFPVTLFSIILIDSHNSFMLCCMQLLNNKCIQRVGTFNLHSTANFSKLSFTILLLSLYLQFIGASLTPWSKVLFRATKWYLVHEQLLSTQWLEFIYCLEFEKANPFRTGLEKCILHYPSTLIFPLLLRSLASSGILRIT